MPDNEDSWLGKYKEEVKIKGDIIKPALELDELHDIVKGFLTSRCTGKRKRKTDGKIYQGKPDEAIQALLTACKNQGLTPTPLLSILK
ncbi:MAG: hypothetical protein GY729_18680 [Desulfobacteraceae bacterium]|nr:hypothetical protein [Desulfobacteraceae bacterium]